MSNVIDQNRIRQFFFIVIILLLGILLFLELSSFLPAMLGAITLYVLLHRPMFYLTEKRKWKKGLTAVLLMLVSIVVILLPVGLLANMLSSKLNYAIQHSSELVEAIKKVAHNAEKRFDMTIVSDENINKLGDAIAQSVMLTLPFSLAPSNMAPPPSFRRDRSNKDEMLLSRRIHELRNYA